jgi:hypothetical protein
VIAIRPDARNFQARFGTILSNCRRPRAILAGAGREGGNLLKRHFREKDRTSANHLAPDRREHLWLKISQSVQAPVVADTSVSITIAHPLIAQKVFGGTIVAKRVKNLSIPIAPDAYGRSPAVFERETGLKLFVLHQGGTKDNAHECLLLAALRGNGRVEVEYLLTPRVTQQADPTALPDEQKFAEAILARAAQIQQRINDGAPN